MKLNQMILKVLSTIDKYLLFILIFLYPLFYLPVFQNTFETSKLLLLSSLILLLSIIKIAKNLIAGTLKFKTSKIDILVIGFSITYLLSSLLASPNKIDAFFIPGTASFVIFGSILYFFINQLDHDDKRQSNFALIISALIYGLVQILSFTGFIKGNLSLFGNQISSFAFLGAMLSMSIFEIIKTKNNIAKIFFSVSSFIIFISAFTSLYLLLPGKVTTPSLPDIKTSWSVSVDSLKENPLLGIGPGNFLESYNKFRPVIVNTKINWNQKYLVASNTFLTIISESGILGFIFFLGLFVLSFNKFNIQKINDISPVRISLLLLFVVSLIYPLTASFLPILFILFSLNSHTKEVGAEFNSKLPLFLIFLPFLSAILFISFVASKVFYSEYIFDNSLKLVSKNEALKAYDEINKSIKSNPYVDRYHLASAQINMAIAESIATKKDLTEDDKKTLTQLIQQAIRESKAAVSLNPSKSQSWEALGDIYLNISPFAKESTKYAVQSYNQAIFLDPINPITRIKLGGVYFADGKYEDAIKAFELAVLAKPDLANSHFNLAMAYKGNKQIEKAKEQMNIVLKLVDPNSKDYQTAKAALEGIDKKEVSDTSQSDSLTTPIVPSEGDQTQVQLPQE